MRAAFLLLVSLSVLSCPPLSPARDSDWAEEEFAAEAVARKKGKAAAKPGARATKPCRAEGCRAVPRAKLVANRDSTYIDLLVSGDSLVRRWPVRVASPVRV